MLTVFEAAGGIDGLRRLAAAWHRRVMADEVVGHAFSHGFHPEHIERLYMSGYSDQAIVSTGVLDSNMPFLQRPFMPAVLARKVREVLERGNGTTTRSSAGRPGGS